VTLLVSGQVDHEHWNQFRKAILDGASSTGTKAVVLDMSQVDFFDSGGIRALISARKTLDADGVGLYIDAPSPQVRHLLETTGLDAYVPPFQLAEADRSP
jgi:anti-sigma B factor antagonist